MKNNLENKKICKYCKSEISRTAQVCPICSKKQGVPQFVITAGIILLLVAIWGGIFAASYFQKKDREIYVDITPVPTPVVIPKVSPTAEAEVTVYGMGETAQIGSLDATMTKYEEGTGGDWNKPGEGKVFLYIEFTLANHSKSDISVTSLIGFKASVDGESTGQSVRATMGGGYEDLNGTVEAGGEMTGIVAYEVPEDWEKVELTFTPDITNRNSLAKFKLEKQAD